MRNLFHPEDAIAWRAAEYLVGKGSERVIEGLGRFIIKAKIITWLTRTAYSF